MDAMRSILVALHGSDPDSAGQELAVAWAQRYNAEALGLAVVDNTVAAPIAVPIGGGAFKQAEEAGLIAGRRRLARMVQQAFTARCQTANVSFRVDQAEGVPHRIVADELQGHDVAIVDNQSPLEYGAGESPAHVLERLIRIAPRPVVSAPRAYCPGDTILVAFDGSTPSARALFGFIGSGLTSGLKVQVLTVDQDSEDSARSRAQRGIDYLQRHSIEVTFRPVVSDRPVSEVICDEAAQQHCDLLVMGPHGRPALVEFFLGSTTKEVIDNSTVPVFLFH